MRATLGGQWAPMVRQLEEERASLEVERDAAVRAAGLPALALDWAELDEEARLVALRGGLERVVIGPGRRGGDPVDRLTVRWLDDD